MSDPVSVSVIIPHYNDSENLAKCLDALAAQQRPPGRCEIIVVDDASPQPIPSVLKLRYPRVLFHRLPRNSGPAAVRNAGLELATGAIIGFVDSDVTVNPNWLSTMVAELADGEMAVCGPLLHSQSWLGRLTAITAFGEHQDPNDGFKDMCLFANAALRREAFDQLRFDELIPFAGEDTVLSAQLRANGLRIRYSTNAAAQHGAALSLSKCLRRAYRYGLGFRIARERMPTLHGAWLHRHLGAVAALPILVYRVGVDMRRGIKYRGNVGLTAANAPATLLGILLLRLAYAGGIVFSYLRFPSQRRPIRG